MDMLCTDPEACEDQMGAICQVRLSSIDSSLHFSCISAKRHIMLTAKVVEGCCVALPRMFQ